MTTTSMRRPDRTAPLAAGWLGLWGVLALVGTLTGAGYPFGTNDAYGESNPLRLLPVRFGPPVFAAVLLGAAVLALAMTGGARPPRPLRALLLGYGWTVAFALAVIVPDTRVLVILGYAGGPGPVRPRPAGDAADPPVRRKPGDPGPTALALLG